MRNKIFNTFLLVLVLTFILTSCKKGNSCYNEELYQKHKNDICPMDCPGVVGCDGKTYCNGCIAMAHGISIQ